jgi:hypothetical protein
VDHRIEPSLPVRLVRDVAHGGERRKITDQHGLGLRKRDPCGLSPGFVAGVQHDRVALFGEQATRHQAEPVR